MSADEAAIPTVCVLLATYNGERWLEEQLDSILGQQDVQVHVLVSDDCSTDGTLEILRRRAAKDGRIEILPAVARRGSAARNFYRLLRAVDTQRYPLVAFADQDDVWMPDRLARHIAVLEGDGADGVSSDVIAVWESGSRVLIRKSFPQRRWDFLLEPPGPGCTFLMRPTVVQACVRVLDLLDAQGMTPLDKHDWLVYLVARSFNLKWRIDDKPSLWYRQHDGNDVGAHVGWRALMSRVSALRRGVYRHLVEQAMQMAAVAASVSGFPAPRRLSGLDILLQGRRRRRDAIVAFLFMPRGLALRKGAVAADGRMQSDG